MENNLGEQQLLELLRRSEEYEDALDVLHPQDEIKPNLPESTLKSGNNSTFAVVVGHTKRSPGALATSPISTNEYYWNKNLAQVIQSKAHSKGIQCAVFYRDGIGITGAYKKVLNWAPDTCIELHFNAFNSKVQGTETLYGELNVESKVWAKAAQESMVALYSRSDNLDRGIKLRKIGERGGRNVNQLEVIPNCLIEPYFGDESKDAALADKFFNELASELVDSHITYMSGS